jgi:glycosyltransferase involved in cell wall biosynthesis
MITPRRCLSVAVPCFDEADTVATLVATVLASPWTAQVIVVDDGSTDGTAKVLADLVAELDDPRLDVVAHEHNRGKGAALRSAFARVTGEYVVVQDADLEYDPREYDVLLEPLERGVADVVFGSRFLGGRPHRVLYFWHSLGNRALTLMSNMFTDLNLTDMESCYKCFRREVVESFTIREDRFGVEPELTAKVAGGGWRIFEVGISYSGRTYAEGKKIGWRDGMWAAVCIIRYSPVLRRLGRRLPRRSALPVWGRSVPPDDLGKK